MRVIVEQKNCLFCNTIFSVYILGVQFCSGDCEIAFHQLAEKNYVDEAESN
jgi:hypothetical protein